MERDRWRLGNELFHAALARDPAERVAFLTAASQDAGVRAEVTSLLAHADDAPTGLTPPERTARSLGSTAETEARGLIGSRLGHYEVIRELGAGGMGVVYLAEDTRLGRSVAVKALSPLYLTDDHARQRLQREAQAAAALTHPAIATVYALEEFDGAPYLVCEYVTGTTLREALRAGPLSTAILLHAGVEIAGALAAAHASHVVHRDLKPDNVMLTPAGAIKILDFGLARFRPPASGDGMAQARLTQPGAVIGTPGYMAPEQLRGEDPDFRADLFAFGVTMYELATGRHPFSGDDAVSTIARVLESEPAPLGRSDSGPEELQPIVSRCLQKAPDARYRHTEDLVRALQAVRPGPPGDTTGSAQGGGADATRSSPRARRSALRWWQLHQLVLGGLSYAMLVPLWVVRSWTPGPLADGWFLGAIATVAVGATLRLHLWFTSRFYAEQLTAQRDRTRRWIQGTDWALVLWLFCAAAASMSRGPAVAAPLVGVAIGSIVSSLVIEPATSRAAFPDSDGV